MDATGFYEYIGIAHISSILNAHRGFLELLEPYVDQSFEDWKKQADLDVNKIQGEQELQSYYQYCADEQARREQFKSILLNSLFTASFSSF